MYFIGIIGEKGSGKSNLLTALLYDEYGNGRKIVANYHLKFPFLYKSFADMTTLSDDLQDAVIGMDELAEGADSYEFLASNPRKITKLVAQIRKRNAVGIYNVQKYGWITKRLRDQTDAFILMEDLDKRKADHTPYNCDGVFRAEFCDEHFRVIRTAVFDGKPFRSLYDTQEIISSGYKEKEAAEIEKASPKKKKGPIRTKAKDADEQALIDHYNSLLESEL